MIKVGQTLEETCEAINKEFNQKVDKETKIAGVSLEGDVSSIDLVSGLFKTTNCLSQVVDKDGTVHPVSEEDYNLLDNCAEDLEDWGDWTEPDMGD